MRLLNFGVLGLLFFGTMLFANDPILDKKGDLKGVVVTEEGLAVPFASVEIEDINDASHLVDGALTGENGRFQIEKMEYGEYRIYISALGFTEYQANFKIENKETDLGEIVLKAADVELEGVEVRGEVSKITQQIDRRVVEVGKDLVSAGATAAEVLNNIPSLSVDQQSGELTLRGNQNVRVFVDGKPTNVPVRQLLQQLPSNSIAKVEIITNPSAKYDPDGNSGIINIVTIKNKRKGWNVNLDGGFTKANREKYNGGINGNLNTGSFNFFGSYNLNFGQGAFRGQIENFDTDLLQNFFLANDFNSQLAKVGFDWFINEKTALTVYTNQNFFDGENRNQSFVTNTALNQTDLDLTRSDNDNHNQDYSLNFKRDFEQDGHFLELDGFFSFGDNQEDADFNWQSQPEGDFIQDYQQSNTENRDQIRLRLDYTKPVWKKGKLEAGSQFLQEGIKNEFFTDQFIVGTFNPDGTIATTIEQQDIFYDFTRDIYSAYLNLGYQWEKWGMQLGLRGEYVNESAPTRLFGSADIQDDEVEFTNDYRELYPSAFFTYNLSERSQLSFNYSRRIDRPGVFQISPVRRWQTATVRDIGNPQLRPQFTNSFEMGFLQRFKKGSNINANIFYRKINDEITRFLEVDPFNENITLLQYTNNPDNEAYGIEFSGFIKAKKWWSFNFGLDYFFNTIIGPDPTQVGSTIEVDNNVFNGRLSNDFKLGKKLSLQSFTMLRGRNQFLQGTQNPMFRQDVGLRYTFADGKGSLSARYSDIFRTFFADIDINNPVPQAGEFRWEASSFYIGFNYSFGGKVKTRADKQRNQSQGGGGGGIGF